MSLILFLLRRSRRVVAASVVAAVACGVGGVALIAIVQAELTRAEPGGRGVAVGFAGLCLAVAASRIVARVAMARLGQGAVADLVTLIGRKVLDLPLARFEAIDASSLLAVLTEDIVLIANALTGIPQLCINGPMVALGLVYVGWLSPTVLVYGAGFAAVALLVDSRLMGPAMRRFRAARLGQDALVGHVRTLLDGFRELKQNGKRAEALMARGLGPAAAEVRDRTVAGQVYFALAESWSGLAFFGFIGSILFVPPTLTGLDRAGSAGLVLVVLYLMAPMDALLTWLPVIGRARASMERVEAILPHLDVEPPPPGSTTAAFGPRPHLRREVRLEGVTYAYPDDGDRDGFALGPIDLTLRAGEIAILAGGNGAGKTTLVKILSGLYAPASGSIRLDGRPVGEADRSAYRQLVSVVFADGHVFRDTFGLERPGFEAEVRDGLQRLGLADRVDHADGLYSTTDLSQGQRRRLAMLSALLEDRPVCVFDEWTANQDPASRRDFYRAILPRLRDRGKALLVISHDAAHHDVADRLLRLEAGRVVEVEADGHLSSPYESEPDADTVLATRSERDDPR